MPLLAAILRHRRLVLVLHALLVVAALPGLTRLVIDNSPEGFFVRDAAALERYRAFQLDFGRDRAVRLVVSGERLWTREGLAWLGDLETAAADLQGVFGSAGLAGHHRGRLGGWPPDDPDAFRRQALADPLDRPAGWVGEDGRIATVLIALYNLPPERQRRTLAALERLLADAPPGVSTGMVGLPVVQEAADASVLRFAARFFPLLVLLASGLLLAGLRDAGGVGLPLSLVAVTLTGVFGVMGYAGARLDLVTVLLVALLFVIALATAVHVLVRYRDLARERGGGPEAVLATYREKAWPVLWTGLTTGAAFGSLLLASVPPVRALGLFSAVGIAWMTLVAFTYLPAALASVGAARGAGSGFEGRMRSLGRRWAHWAVVRRGWVGGLFALLGLLALAGLPRLEQESNVLTYFRPEHPARVALEALEDDGIGAVAAELVLARRAPGQPPFEDPAALLELTRLGDALHGGPHLLGVVGAGELLESVARWRLPGRDPAAVADEAYALAMAEPPTRQLLAALRTADGERARVSLILAMEGVEELEPLFERVRERAGALFPDLEVEITGRYPLVLAAQRHLLGTVAASLGVTLVVVMGVLVLLVRRWRLAAAVMAPNLWPVALVVGGMGWARVPVDSTTVMIASVVLGLAVDDTLHTLGRFRHLLPRLGAETAAVATLERIAPAHVLTSAILAAGFGVCSLSEFLPVARFGALAAVAILGALAADLLLVPALLAAAGRRP